MQLLVKIAVTPLAGVWIEIDVRVSSCLCASVTPLAGVWIEIIMNIKDHINKTSLPLRECGLKLHILHIPMGAICHSPCGSVD